MKKKNSAERLKELMNILGIKQTDIVEKTGIPKSAMSMYISGQRAPRQNRLSLIADAYNVDEAWLMGYDVPMEKKYTFDKAVNDFFNEINAFDMQLKALGWTYEPMGCHAIGQSIEFELKLNDNGNFTDTEDNHTIGCNGKKCENCTEEESYYLFTNGEISFKVSIDDYDSFINDSQTFFKERLQQLLKKSMRQMFIENSYELKAAHNDNADNSEQQRLMAEDMKDIEENW